MGQYYKPVCLDLRQYLHSHDFTEKFLRDDGQTYECGQGLKLMEHSYVGNIMMNAVEHLLMPGEPWCKKQLVWAGDYADGERGTDNYDPNLYHIMDDKGTKIMPPDSYRKPVPKSYKFLLNHTKRKFIDLSTLKEDEDGYKIHPLPLYSCEGNGRGGGDFHGKDERIGTWARDELSISNDVPPHFSEVPGQFTEQRCTACNVAWPFPGDTICYHCQTKKK